VLGAFIGKYPIRIYQLLDGTSGTFVGFNSRFKHKLLDKIPIKDRK